MQPILAIIASAALGERGTVGVSTVRGRTLALHSAGPTRSPIEDAPGGYNETYGYPDGIGGLIVEGPFAYPHGPPVWSDDNPSGAYGMLIAPGSFAAGKCEAIPADSVFAKGGLHPLKMTNGGDECLLACNKTDVQATGVDPCHIGSLADPLSNSRMSCYDLGPGTAGGGGGACGYNCSALVASAAQKDKVVPCKAADVKKGDCNIYCDTRTFPGKS